jgi:hypothetical protein
MISKHYWECIQVNRNDMTKNPKPHQPSSKTIRPASLYRLIGAALLAGTLSVLLLAGCASRPRIEDDCFFLPCAPDAKISFEGETQAGGREVHRIEICRLAYMMPKANKMRPANGSCIIYYAGKEYGPEILYYFDDCINPFVRMVLTNTVEVYYLAGAHSHFRQTWRLLGYTAKLEKEEDIEWSDDPRNKNSPN